MHISLGFTIPTYGHLFLSLFINKNTTTWENVPYDINQWGLSWVCTFIKSGPEVIKLFSCSTQLSMKFFLLINLKSLTIANSFLLTIAEHEIFFDNKYENANYCWNFHIYLQRKFHALLSLAWKKFYNLWAWSQSLLLAWRNLGSWLSDSPVKNNTFSCSTQLSMTFSLLINMKMPTTVY